MFGKKDYKRMGGRLAGLDSQGIWDLGIKDGIVMCFKDCN